MRISVSIKINSKTESVERQEDGTFLVRIRVPPVDGKANKRIIELLSEYFKISKTSVEIISGFKGKKKIVQLK